MSATAPRIVLDSNVCLDLFAFKDPAVAPLLQALRQGTVQAVADPACRDEWLRVIEYPKLGLDDAARAACRDDYDRLVQLLPAAAQWPALPRCADPDDQKFLELAQAAQARWLLSRDHALLVLGRRTARAGLFDILTPRAWVALQRLHAATP